MERLVVEIAIAVAVQGAGFLSFWWYARKQHLSLKALAVAIEHRERSLHDEFQEIAAEAAKDVADARQEATDFLNAKQYERVIYRDCANCGRKLWKWAEREGRVVCQDAKTCAKVVARAV
jgi:selenocysteine lyase/cysteine desulfurase